MKNGIFISYKRGADSADARTLYAALSENFGSDRVRMDVDSFPLGDDFVAHIRSEMELCHVVLVVIGRGFHERIDELSSDGDFMRLELEQALGDPGKKVIPVLFDGAGMPAKAALPEPVQNIVFRGGVSIDHANSGIILRHKLVPDLEQIFSVISGLNPGKNVILKEADQNFRSPKSEALSKLSISIWLAFFLGISVWSLVLSTTGFEGIFRHFEWLGEISVSGVPGGGTLSERRVVEKAPEIDMIKPSVTEFNDGYLDLDLDEIPSDPTRFEGASMTLWGHKDLISDVVFSPLGDKVATASNDKSVRLWDAQTGEPIGQSLEGHEDWITSLVFSPDGETLISGSFDGSIRLWNAKYMQQIGEPLEASGLAEGGVANLAISVDGEHLAGAYHDGTIVIWDIQSKKAVVQTLRGSDFRKKSADQIVFSQDAKKLIIGSHYGELRIWDIKNERFLLKIPDVGYRFRSIAISPDGRLLAGAVDRVVRFWHLESGVEIEPSFQSHFGVVESVTFSPGGDTIISASADGAAKIWLFGSSKELSNATGLFRKLALSPLGDQVALFGKSSEVVILRLKP